MNREPGTTIEKDLGMSQESLIEKLQALKLKSVARLEDPETGFAINGAIEACIQEVRRHEAEQSQDLVERVENALRECEYHSRGFSGFWKKMANAAIAAMGDAAIRKDAECSDPARSTSPTETLNQERDRLISFARENHDWSQDWQKGVEDAVAIATNFLKRSEISVVPEEAGYVAAQQKMREIFPTRNSGFISEATWHVLEAYLGRNPKRKINRVPDDLLHRLKNVLFNVNRGLSDHSALAGVRLYLQDLIAEIEGGQL